MSWDLKLDAGRTASASRILGGTDILDIMRREASSMLDEGRRLWVLSDTNVWESLGEMIVGSGGLGETGVSFHMLPSGEEGKNMGTVERIWTWLAEGHARRDDAVVAVGGGVVGDTAGFAAATFMRGMEFWQLPTTLLAQVDSSVGGKVGVNLPAGKNMVGAFYQPGLVIIDHNCLRTLPESEYRSGLGEIVKYGLLDRENLFEYLCSNGKRLKRRETDVLEETVRRCVALKAEVVAADERDQGTRAVLNLGHTTAHALEVSLGYGEIAHGEAVGLGLLVALAVGETAIGTDPTLQGRVRQLLASLSLPTQITLPDTRSLLAGIHTDKKISADSTGFVSVRRPGEPVWGIDVSDDIVMGAFEVIRA